MFRQRLQRMIQLLIFPLKRSIRTRLIITMITIVILPTVAVTLLATDNSKQAMEDEVINTNLSNIKWTGIYLDQQFDQLNSHIYPRSFIPKVLENRFPINFVKDHAIINAAIV